MSNLIILGLDPGKNNFGAAVSKIDIKTGLRSKVLHTRMIENAIIDLTGNIDKERKKFSKELSKIIKEFSVDVLIAERFMTRGRFSGASTEYISFMLGIISTINKETRFITAAQWKNAFNKITPLEDFYSEIPIVPHKIDAALISLYAAHYFTDTKPFQCIQDIELCKRQITKSE
jgi:hypothetical protein